LLLCQIKTESIEMKDQLKILVTGATGFVGNHVVNYLLKNTNNKVIASSRSIEKARRFSWFDRVSYIPWTINNSTPANIFDQFDRPDLCIHLAWDGLPKL